MREIKIKAWHKKEKKFYTVCLLGFGGNATLVREIDPQKRFEALRSYWYPNKDFEFLLYTGLKDKNGHEIYKGDILAPNLRVVEYKTDLRLESIYEVYGGAGFYTRSHNITRAESIGVFSFGQTQSEVSKIIGNIYENKELLT